LSKICLQFDVVGEAGARDNIMTMCKLMVVTRQQTLERCVHLLTRFATSDNDAAAVIMYDPTAKEIVPATFVFFHVSNDLSQPTRLVDSIKKKATMTEMFAAHTALKDITVLNARAEDLVAQPQYRKSFDVVISRAVARTGTVLSWITESVKPDCKCAFLKGGDLAEELAEAREMHPSWTITEQPIRVFGHPWFEENDKKVVLCKQG